MTIPVVVEESHEIMPPLGQQRVGDDLAVPAGPRDGNLHLAPQPIGEPSSPTVVRHVPDPRRERAAIRVVSGAIEARRSARVSPRSATTSASAGLAATPGIM